LSLLELLLEEKDKGEGGTIGDCGRVAYS